MAVTLTCMIERLAVRCSTLRGVRRGLVAILALFLGCSSGAGTVPMTLYPEGGSVRIQVEVADQPAEQAQGLMGRTELADDRGMVFVWESPAPRSFWMKGTLIDLDLVGILAGRVVSITTMQPCAADPCERYPTPSADAVLEVRGGWAEDHGLELGDLVDSEVLA